MFFRPPSWVLISYLNRLFLSRFTLVLTGLSGILALFDLLANAGDVVEYADNIAGNLLTYLTLRYPEIIYILIPIAALLSALSVIIQKVNSQELIAIRSCGISIYRVIGYFCWGGMLIAIFHFSIANFVLPHSSYKLFLWSEAEYKGSPPERRTADQVTNWIAAGNSLIHIENASSDGHILRNILIITRQDNGVLKDYLTADRAEYKGNAWHLSNVMYPSNTLRPNLQTNLSANLSANLPAITTDKIIIDLPLKPSFFAKTIAQPQALNINDLWRLIQNDVALERPVYVYTLWFYQKISAPLSVLIMILLTAPLALKLSRRDSLMITSFYVISCGFLYMILQQIIASMGENGAIAPSLAAFSPMALYACIIIWFLLLKEG